MPGAAEVADLVSGQIKGLQVGAQGHDDDRRAGGRGQLLLDKEEQLLGWRRRLVRGRAVQRASGAMCGAQPSSEHAGGEEGSVVAQRHARDVPLPRLQRQEGHGWVSGRPPVPAEDGGRYSGARRGSG
ncbi:hypothetical protein ACH4E5_41750 [Streptomyces afghaniensis]|uniref:hypothetical protein n=1 Tax=Streptomyces afghaniensis TaxID=66865 RepID=UPI003793186F